MKLAMASGKGGTGKTTISTNLSVTISRHDRTVTYVVLVTEPTPFGLHDLRLAVDVARTLNRPCGVVVNRAVPAASETREWCAQAGVPILAEIPDSVEIAKAYSRGELAVESVPGLGEIFDKLFLRLQEEVHS